MTGLVELLKGYRDAWGSSRRLKPVNSQTILSIDFPQSEFVADVDSSDRTQRYLQNGPPSYHGITPAEVDAVIEELLEQKRKEIYGKFND